MSVGFILCDKARMDAPLRLAVSYEGNSMYLLVRKNMAWHREHGTSTYSPT